MSTSETIKTGDSNIVAAVREYWDEMLQDKIYAMSLSRNLAGAVNVIARYGQGIDNTYRWTRSKGITTTDSDRYDIGSTDLYLNQVEYEVEEKNLSASPFGGFVAQKLDILRDQQGFIMPNIMSSLARDLAEKENTVFVALLNDNATDVVETADAEEISLVGIRKLSTSIEKNNLEPLYFLMSPETIQSFADDMTDAAYVGDSQFLRNNVVGRLWGCTVVKSTRIPDNEVYCLGEDAAVLYEREPYTLNMARDNVSDYFVKFAIQARFGFGVDRAESITKGTFLGDVTSS